MIRIRKKISLSIVFLIVRVSMPGIAFGQVITNKNWVNHPQIVEIRKVCTEIENLISEDSLKKQTIRDTTETSRSETNGYMALTDSTIRKVQMWYSEDFCMVGAHWEVSTYYERGTNRKDGSLRFIYATFETDDGRKAEYREYFDRKGARIWLNRKILKNNNKEIPDDVP